MQELLSGCFQIYTSFYDNKISENLKVKSFGNLIFKLDVAHRTILRYKTILSLTIQSSLLFEKVKQILILMQTLKRDIA